MCYVTHIDNSRASRFKCGLFSAVLCRSVGVVHCGNVGRTSVTATGGLPYVVTEQKAGSGAGGVQMCGANNPFPKKRKNEKFKNEKNDFKAF